MGRILVADTLPRSETLIIADYRDNPVPREYDPRTPVTTSNAPAWCLCPHRK